VPAGDDFNACKAASGCNH